MQVVIDTDKLSEKASQWISSIEDAQSIIIEMIEVQAQRKDNENNQNIIEILKRLEKKIDNLERPAYKKQNFAEQSKIFNSKEDSQKRINSHQENESDRKAAEDELAKALDFFT